MKVPHNTMLRSAGLGLVLLCLGGASQAASAPDPQALIRRNLEQWPKDFAAGNAAGVCSLYARDLVASYPGQADRDYDTMCANLTAMAKDAQHKFSYEAPRIEVLTVSGELAVVRLVWTLHIKSGSDEGLPLYERALEVFKRQPDGSWKVAMTLSYPDASAGQ